MNELEILNRKAEIYKLSIAKASIDEAADAASLIFNRNIQPNNPLYRPLHAAMVIAYGRAFSEMKPLGKISSRWERFEDPSDQRTHDALMRQRQTMVGHADHIAERVMIYASGDEMDNGEIAKNAQTVYLANFIPPGDFVHILRLAGGLFAKMSIAISEKMEEMYGEEGVNLHNSFELISEADLERMKDLRG